MERVGEDGVREREGLRTEEDEKRLKEAVSLPTLIFYLLMNTCLKILMQLVIGPSLQKFPHFRTPLSSLAQIKEGMISGDVQKFLDPRSTNQSVLVIVLFKAILAVAGDDPVAEENVVFFFLCLVDVVIMVVQLMIIDTVWGKKKFVREFEVVVVLLMVFYSPLQMSAIPAQNVGMIKDLFNYLCIYAFLLPSGKELSAPLQALLSGATLYLDPSSWSMVLGFMLCDPRKKSVAFQLALCLIVSCGLVAASSCLGIATFGEQI